MKRGIKNSEKGKVKRITKKNYGKTKRAQVKGTLRAKISKQEEQRKGKRLFAYIRLNEKSNSKSHDNSISN